MRIFIPWRSHGMKIREMSPLRKKKPLRFRKGLLNRKYIRLCFRLSAVRANSRRLLSRLAFVDWQFRSEFAGFCRKVCICLLGFCAQVCVLGFRLIQNRRHTL